MSADERTRAYICTLLDSDPLFADYWEGLGSRGQRRIQRQIRLIANTGPKDRNELRTEHRRVSRLLADWFTVVRPQTLLHGLLSPRWHELITDIDALTTLNRDGFRSLVGFCHAIGFRRSAALVGGVKPSLIHPPRQDEGRVADPQICNVLDAVRYRLIVPTVWHLQKAAIAVWTHLRMRVVKCRNFYLWPRNGEHDRTYRAVHFIVAIPGAIPGRVVELQLVSAARHIMSHLDHVVLYKRRVDLGEEWEHWVTDLVRRSTLYDASLVKRRLGILCSIRSRISDDLLLDPIPQD